MVEPMVPTNPTDTTDVRLPDTLYPTLCIRPTPRRYTTLVDGTNGRLGEIQSSRHRLVSISLVAGTKHLYAILPNRDYRTVGCW